MKALTLCVLLGGTQLMRLFSASGVSLCFYFTLFTRLLMSLLLRLSGCTGRRRHARKRRPVAWSSSGLVPQGLFHSCDHYTFFSMLSWGNESFLSVKVFLVKILHFLTSISPFYIALLDSRPRGTAVPYMRKYLSNIHEFGRVRANYNIKSRISLKCPHLK